MIRYFILTSLLMLLMFQGAAMAQFENHPRFAHIDTKMKAFIQSVSDKQAEYFAINNKYFQGILTPDTIQDGLTDADVNWAVKPGDQEESWKDFAPNIFKSRVKVPFQIRIDVYESPDGWGWVLTIEIWISGLDPDQFGTYGDHWVYRYHEGPQPIGEEWLNNWHIEPLPED